MQRIRSATLSDIAKLAEIKIENYFLPEQDVALLTLKNFFLDEFKKRLLRRFTQGVDILVVIEEKNIIGFLTYTVELNNQCQIQGIYVVPNKRFIKLGTSLCEAAFSEMRKRQCPQVSVWVPAENHQLKRFYEKVGFVATAELMLRESISLVEIKYVYILSKL